MCGNTMLLVTSRSLAIILDHIYMYVLYMTTFAILIYDCMQPL